MADLTTTLLNADSHLLLDQPLLRLPFELIRKNFQSSRRAVEREREQILSNLVTTADASRAGAPATNAAASLDGMINRMQGLKRKLEALQEEERIVHHQSKKRIQHLQDLYNIPSLIDVKYEEWSRVRLNRLLVDYMLRTGYEGSARALAKDRGIEDLVDIETFVQCSRIRDALRQQRTQECLAWCNDNKQALKKINSDLEFKIRFQQYVELVRTRQPDKIREARTYASKYFIPHKNTHAVEIREAAGLLVYPSNTLVDRYAQMYSSDRWDHLAERFVQTYHHLLSLPDRPLLHIALSAGLSSLKTPACHSKIASSSSNANSTTTSVCPICSTELNELARNVPYAHHTKSLVESDPVVLPNGRIYGRERLIEVSPAAGSQEVLYRDPTSRETFHEHEILKVYIS